MRVWLAGSELPVDPGHLMGVRFPAAPFRTFRAPSALRAVVPGQDREPGGGYVRHPSGPSKKVRAAVGRQIWAAGSTGGASKASA